MTVPPEFYECRATSLDRPQASFLFCNRPAAFALECKSNGLVVIFFVIEPRLIGEGVTGIHKRMKFLGLVGKCSHYSVQFRLTSMFRLVMNGSKLFNANPVFKVQFSYNS